MMTLGYWYYYTATTIVVAPTTAAPLLFDIYGGAFACGNMFATLSCFLRVIPDWKMGKLSWKGSESCYTQNNNVSTNLYHM